VLGPALAPFALLAGATISNTGATLVTFAPGATSGGFNDDLIGVSPGTVVTGFPPGMDADGTNAIYATGFNVNAAMPLAAENALTAAYTTAAGRAATTSFIGTPDLSLVSSGAANCGATGSLACAAGTLGAGVYRATTSASITVGNLTLDGGGNTQSVFIFQIGSTLTTTVNGAAGGNVILINGASACNIYWQIGSTATLGGVTFSGNVLAFSSITINASAFTGRALSGGPSLGTGTVSIPIAGGSLITNPGGN